MGSNQVDIQCQKIAKGIDDLLELLNSDMIKRSLEIGTNHLSSDYYNLLNRLERSLDQYIKRDKSLFYIGFLGHFSSGKSSTINSILNLWGTPDERKRDQNPTDNGITLITNRKNRNYVIRSVRGGIVPVVVISVDDRILLDNTVIIDTPGSGDPLMLEEVVRDALPLCDLLLYCFSGASPLSSSDIPLLKEKEKNLKEIPTLFIVTRASEFKINNLQQVTENNIDHEKAQEVLHGLIVRMKGIFKSTNLTIDDFILIDSIDNYNISRLITLITEKSNPENVENAIKLHSHKINYYVRIANEIKNYFLNIITDQLQTIEEFVAKAQKNIDEYEKKTKIGTDTLNQNFSVILKNVNHVLDGAIGENVKVRDVLSTPLEFNEIDQVRSWKRSVISDIESIFIKELKDIENKISTKLYDVKEKVKQKLYSLSISEISISKTEFAEEFELLMKNIDLPTKVEFQFYHWYSDIFNRIKRFLETDRKTIILKNVESIFNRVHLKKPLESINQSISDANKNLSSIFQSYDAAVRMYRVAALANETKMFIRKLGLSEELDAQDSLNINIDESKEIAFHQIFNRYEQFINEFKSTCVNLEEQLKLIKVNLRDFELANSEKVTKLQENILVDFQNSINNNLNLLKQNMQSYYTEKIDSIQNEILIRETDKEKRLEKLRKLHMEKYVKRFVPAFLILIITVSMFYIFPKIDVFQNLSTAQEWLLGLLVNFCSFLFSLFYAKRNDKFPIEKLQLETSFEGDKRILINQIIESDYYDIHNKQISSFINTVKEQSSQLNRNNVSELLGTEISETLLENHTLIIQNEKHLKKAISDYTTQLEALKNILFVILNNEKINKSILLEQAEDIRRKRINPSFDLLFSTKTRISDVKDNIENVSFF